MTIRHPVGYLVIDHRNSPGLPEEFGGRPVHPLLREGKLFEADTLTCAHCKTVVIKRPERTRERGWCRKCDHYICDPCTAAACAPDYVHTPFERAVDGYPQPSILIRSL